MKKLILLCCGAALPFSAAASFVSINETWSNGDRTTQDPANNSLAWWTSSNPAQLTAVPGAMTQVTGTGGRHALAYFTNAGSPVILGVGERIEMNFRVTFPGGFFGGNPEPTFGPNGDFRVGLFNSGGSRVTEDNHAGTNANPGNANFNPIFLPSTGYMFTGRILGQENSNMSLRKRLPDQDGGGAFMLAISPFETLDGTEAAVPLSPGVVYDGLLVVDRVGLDATQVTYTLSDGVSTLINLVRMDESGAFFSFDTVGFSLGSQTATAFEIHQVHIAVIPEPSTYALLFGVFGLAWVLIRRRKK